MLLILDEYNRKERNYVVNYCLSNKHEGSLELHQNFIKEIENSIGVAGAISRESHFASLEYNFDWLYAAMENYNNKNSFTMPQLRTNNSFFKGSNNSDIDLLTVTYNQGKYDFYLVEAKYGANWNKEQIEKKIKLMKEVFNNNSSNDVGNVYYIFYSNNESQNKAILNYANNLNINFQNFKGFYEITIAPTNSRKQKIYQELAKNSNIETSILAQHVLAGDFEFKDIGVNLKNELIKNGINISEDFFISIDYSFLNLYKAFGLNISAKGRTDIDLLLVDEKKGGGYKFIFLEAKVYTSWDEEQIKNKVDHIKKLYNERQNQNDDYILIFLDKTFTKCKYVIENYNKIPGLQVLYLPLKLSTRYRTQRCNINKHGDKNGGYWNKKKA